MTRVVIESPLGAPTRAQIDTHKRYARRAVLDSLARGEAPYAAHLFYDQPGLLDDLLPDQRQQGLRAGLLWATTADVCAVYLDLGCSDGMVQGLDQARRLGQRVSFRFLDQWNGDALSRAVWAGTGVAEWLYGPTLVCTAASEAATAAYKWRDRQETLQPGLPGPVS